MSTGQPLAGTSWGDHDLEYGTDDPDDPEELTIFAPESSSLTTEWITIEYDEAIPSTEWE
ncbi:hypothetical protein [Haloglomus litoreum]|uniref:hypothetical protein n=1 Tax=Haloglomus litoreum TaxID=3034026 RepID=UPI0023E815E7|nr:hypothetical protein [Haloglomus sp. DT116]